MKEEVTPEKIHQNFLKGDLNKEDASDLLISLVNESEDAIIRRKSIDLLEKIDFQDDTIFKILENHLISDENANVRASAARVIILNFLDEGLEPIEWSTKNDKSPIVIKTIIDTFERRKESNHEAIESNLHIFMENLALNLGVVYEEARFFLDLEAIFSINKVNYKVNPFDYKNFEVLFNCKDSEPWLVIKNKHVEILDLNFFNWGFIKENGEIFDSFSRLKNLEFYLNTIRKYSKFNFESTTVPESIGKLTSLKKLKLARNNLEIIPDSIRNLTCLSKLDLSHNCFQEIPPILKSLNSLEILNMKYNNIQTISHSMKNFVNSLVEFKF
ncbi:MAG: hypothetical protein ACFFBE_15390 [Promethearchaeota archaeon]